MQFPLLYKRHLQTLRPKLSPYFYEISYKQNVSDARFEWRLFLPEKFVRDPLDELSL